MKAVGFYAPRPVGEPGPLVDLELPLPVLRPNDPLVRLAAISVNRIDTTLRSSMRPPTGTAQVVGYNAAGMVEAVGPAVTRFKAGDEVFYAGAIDRQGSYAEFQAVDERVVEPKPRTLSFADAAALPLTSLTGWELLFDRLRVSEGRSTTGDALLIINGAGGVGSILTRR